MPSSDSTPTARPRSGRTANSSLVTRHSSLRPPSGRALLLFDLDGTLIDSRRALRDAGYALALVTNKPAAHARRIFDHFGWTPLFAVLMAGGDTPELKPSPVPILEALRRTATPPDRALMVGDHHTDLEAARRAGLPPVLLHNGFGNTGAETPPHAFPDFAAFARSLLP